MNQPAAYEAGVPIGLTGIRSAPAGIVSRPAERDMLGWRQDPLPVTEQHSCWLLGAHGGAGVSATIRTLADTGLIAGDAQRAWPVPDSRAVIVVARTHAAGIGAALIAAQQHLSGYSPPGTVLAGALLVPDGPGRLPKQLLSEITRQIAGVYPETWVLPWSEPLRLCHPDPRRSPQWPPPAAAAAAVAEQITRTLNTPTQQ
ncbi:MAG: DUF6668 family protein, partial [Jatrophihabitantaceae bacterium]